MDLLYDASEDLFTLGAPSPPRDFNHARLACPPKKASWTHDQLGPVYSAEGTRPLSLANTDNKTIASAMRLCLEPCADVWVGPTQRGFIGGRNMSRNILEMDTEIRESALCGERGPRGPGIVL